MASTKKDGEVSEKRPISQGIISGMLVSDSRNRTARQSFNSSHSVGRIGNYGRRKNPVQT